MAKTSDTGPAERWARLEALAIERAEHAERLGARTTAAYWWNAAIGYGVELLASPEVYLEARGDRVHAYLDRGGV